MYVVKRSSLPIVALLVPVAFEFLLRVHLRLLLAEKMPESPPTVLMLWPVSNLGLFVLLPVFSMSPLDDS